MIIKGALLLFIIKLCCQKSLATIYPNVPCPNIFRYVRDSNINFGIVTLENVNYGETVLELELSQPGTVYPGAEGNLNLNIDENQISEYIRTKSPITYKVNFPHGNAVPQVSKIIVNGNTVCNGKRVTGSSTTITLKHTLTATGPMNMPQLFGHATEPRSISQNIGGQYPSVPCPSIFQYVRVGSDNVGLITIDGINYGETVLEVELSQPGSLQPGREGYLNLNIDENQIFEYIRSRRPITYKVNFPVRYIVPQVTTVRLNGNTICNGQRVAAPSTTITLKHTLTAPPPLGGMPAGEIFNAPTNLPWPFLPNVPNWPHFRNANIISSPFLHSNETRKSFNNNGHHYTVTQPTTTKRPFITNSNKVLQSNGQNANESNRDNHLVVTPQTTTKKPLRTSSVRTSSTTSTTTSTTRPTIPLTIKNNPEVPTTIEYINSVCGRENINFTVKKLAVNGEEVPRARFPWIVAIFKKTEGSLSFQCGGSLISTRTVISAAHCFYAEFEVIKNEDILVSLGRHDLTDWSDSYIIHSDVERIIRHPDYRPELINIDADLAIVRLKNVITFSQAIRPVCLWQGPLNVRDIEGVAGIVVGWGRDKNNSAVTTSPRLVKANVASEITCIRSNNQLFYLTSNRTLCAGNRDGTGPCNGDSGSGLMIRNRNKWMLRGTVSAALGSAVNQCNLEDYVVYTDIAMFLVWIEENMLI